MCSLLTVKTNNGKSPRETGKNPRNSDRLPTSNLSSCRYLRSRTLNDKLPTELGELLVPPASDGFYTCLQPSMQIPNPPRSELVPVFTVN
jgi:hypothetical protein